MARRWRTWAYESAGLDLALAQAGRALHEVLELEPRPVTFVNSLGLGDPPVADTILRRLERYPSVRFKLDAAVAWTPEIVAALVGTGAVHTIDFKGQYGLEVEDPDALAAMYEMLLEAFPDALLEDPHDLPEITPLVEPHAGRVAYDAPIRTAADLDATPLPARTFNIKPSRIGGLQTLLELYATCDARGLAMYGGGMGELGVAHGQIQVLASLFIPTPPTTSRRPASTRSIPPPACRQARWPPPPRRPAFAAPTDAVSHAARGASGIGVRTARALAAAGAAVTLAVRTCHREAHAGSGPGR